MFDQVNWIAVIGAAFVAFIIGWLWYGPLFGKRWMQLTGKRPGENMEGSWLPIAVAAIMSLVGATALAVLTTAFPNDLFTAAFVALLVWVASGLALKVNDMNFGGQPAGLFYLDSIGHLVVLVVMAVIVSTFRM
ncbi:MAG: DUF1761 domain-containing protein [Candidatus Limnocylindria bacterium]